MTLARARGCGQPDEDPPLVTSGRVVWATGPTDPALAPFLAAEARNLTREIHSAQQARWDAEADAFCSTMAATLED